LYKVAVESPRVGGAPPFYIYEKRGDENMFGSSDKRRHPERFQKELAADYARDVEMGWMPGSYKLSCQHCGATFYRWYPLAKWCSYRCRNDAHIQRRRERRRLARMKKCHECGAPFEARRCDAKFCSVACRQRAHRRRVTDAGCANIGSTCTRDEKRMNSHV